MLQPDLWSTTAYVHDTSHKRSDKLEMAKWKILGEIFVDPCIPVKLSHASETPDSQSPYGPLKKTQPFDSKKQRPSMGETHISSEKKIREKSKTATGNINRWEGGRGQPLTLSC
jgi:hypothetical protein